MVIERSFDFELGIDRFASFRDGVFPLGVVIQVIKVGAEIGVFQIGMVLVVVYFSFVELFSFAHVLQLILYIIILVHPFFFECFSMISIMVI